jgi:hypothetical protein
VRRLQDLIALEGTNCHGSGVKDRRIGMLLEDLNNLFNKILICLIARKS